MNNFDWYDYSWEWSSPDDVREFVDLILENHDRYEYAYEYFSNTEGEIFYIRWWAPVQNAIESMAKNFTREDLVKSMHHLLAPEGEFIECDPAIFDALLKFVPGFPAAYPEFEEAIASFLNIEVNYSSDWWDFSWYQFIGAEFTWTFWGPETLARTTNVSAEILTHIFTLSFNAETPYKSFRSRVALASNPATPPVILEFLFSNRLSSDWLIIDTEEVGVITLENGRYSINEECQELPSLRDDANLTNNFAYPTDDNWSSGPNASFVLNLLDIEWEADTAQSCLLAALAKNPSLDSEKYFTLAEHDHPLVRYFLSINPSIPESLKEKFAVEKPTFTYKPYGSHPRYTDEVTLGI